MKVMIKPLGIADYYKSLKKRAEANIETYTSELTKAINKTNSLHRKILKDIDVFRNKYSISLNHYREFKENKYIDGTFHKMAKGAYLNRKNDYELTSDLFDLLSLANGQQKVARLTKAVKVTSKILELNYFQYRAFIKEYYMKVQRAMIIDGYGYKFEGNTGWICINRVHRSNDKFFVAFNETNKERRRLKELGKRVYNKDEEEWCLKHGIEYHYEDHRRYLSEEYYYEIAYINLGLQKHRNIYFQPTDSFDWHYRGKSYEDVIADLGEDPEKICETNFDMKKKLAIILLFNKTIYSKYIRNEDQKSYRNFAFGGKNR